MSLQRATLSGKLIVALLLIWCKRDLECLSPTVDYERLEDSCTALTEYLPWATVWVKIGVLALVFAFAAGRVRWLPVAMDRLLAGSCLFGLVGDGHWRF